MNRTTVFARTAKGMREVGAWSHVIARDRRMVLGAVDGKSSVETLRSRFDFLSPGEIDEALDELAAAGFIRELAGPDSASAEPADAHPLPAAEGETEASSGQGEESLRKAQALRAKLRGRRQGADRRSAPRAEAADRRFQEQETLRLIEERAQRDMAEQAMRDAAAAALREAAEHARQEAEDRERRALEQQARQQAAEAARREAEERARQDTEEQARWMAEQQAWHKSEEKLRAEQEATARKRAGGKAMQEGRLAEKMPIQWGKPFAYGIAALVAVILVTIHVVSFDAQIPQFEASLTEQLGQPVKIRALRLSLVPHVHLRLEDIAIGNEAQIRVPRVMAAGALGDLFSDRKVFKSLELDSPVMAEEALGWILFGKPLASRMEFGEVSALNATVDSKNVSLPAFDAKLQSDGAGAWKAIALESVDENISVELTPKDGMVAIAFKAKSFKVPFGSALTLEDLVAAGTANGSELVLTDFKGFTHGGTLAGRARLKWGARWSLAGELNAKQIDMSRLLPGVLDDARLAGTASYAMQAAQPAQLFAAPRLEGNFLIPRGILLGIDLGRVLQGGGMRGDTRFTDLSGGLVHEGGATQLRQLHLSQGTMSASGTVDVDADKNVRGRIAAELQLSTDRLRANLALSGTPDKLRWSTR